MATGAAAQETVDRPRLEAEQNRLFERLQEQPDDLDAMFEYAVVSIRLGDYEQAIATLERMLIYRPDLPRVKLELGSAYFKLGSYEVAKFYFDEALEADPPADVRAKVEEFLAAIRARTKQSSLTGVASVGVVYSTNANLGPTERFVEVFGNEAMLDSAFAEADDVGIRASLQLAHRQDLGRPNNDAWLTTAGVTALRYREEEDGNIEALFLKTGPRFDLTAETAGPTLRPFVEGSVIRSANDFLYASIGGGLEYRTPLGENTSLTATVGGRYRDFTAMRNASDSTGFYTQVGVEHGLAEGVTVGGAVFGLVEDARAGFASNHEVGARAAAAYSYVPGLIDAQTPWTLSGFAQVSGRWYDAPDPAVNPSVERHDRDMRVGLSHLFRVSQGWGVSLEASYFDRHSNLSNFRLDNFEVGLFVQKRF